MPTNTLVIVRGYTFTGENLPSMTYRTGVHDMLSLDAVFNAYVATYPRVVRIAFDIGLPVEGTN